MKTDLARTCGQCRRYPQEAIPERLNQLLENKNVNQKVVVFKERGVCLSYNFCTVQAALKFVEGLTGPTGTMRGDNYSN